MGKQGSVLITVLWVILILSLIVWGLSRRSAMDISLMETYEGKLRAYAAARAGLNQVIDAMNQSGSEVDTLKQIGIKIPQGKSMKDIYGPLTMDNGAYAQVQWQAEGFASPIKNVPGLEDEGGKININAINDLNLNILTAYLKIKKCDEVQAQNLAKAIVAYVRHGAGKPGQNWLEFDASTKANMKPKGRPYQHLDELLEVEGMTSDIFDRIKSGLTVYGDSSTGLNVNVRTASTDVLAAFFHAAQDDQPMLDQDELLRTALQLRDGPDGRSFTSDDGTPAFVVDFSEWPQGLKEGKSTYLRVTVHGKDPASGAQAAIEAVIERNMGFGVNRLVSWYRQ